MPTKISVIIPTYNRAQYLVQCIDSVLRQEGAADVFTIEIIIVDDGSTDNTKDIVDRYVKDHKNIKYYLIKNSGGPATPRNVGISKATGEFVAFLDSDDVWLPTKLRRQIEVLNDAEIALCSSNAQIIDSSGSLKKSEYLREEQGKSGLVFDTLVNDNFIITSSVLVRKKVLDEIGGFNEGKDFIAIEDYDMWLRIAAYHKLSYVEEIFVGYRQHDENISADEAVSAIKKIVIVLKRQLKDTLSAGQRRATNNALARYLNSAAVGSRGIRKRVLWLEYRIYTLKGRKRKTRE